MSERALNWGIGVVSVVVVLAVAFLLLGPVPRGAGGPDVSRLPLVNALLNGGSAVLLVVGFGLIRRRRVGAHRAAMLTAFVLSVLFLVSYVVYHWVAGSKAFAGQGWIRPVYFVLLVTHIVLAAAIVPLALVTISRGLGGRIARHRQIARWTLPLWLYVSVTGVVIYLLLYHGPQLGGLAGPQLGGLAGPTGR